MASELGRGLGAGPEEAADRLLSLSPFETKTLLHHLLSGREYGLSSGAGSKETVVHLCNLESSDLSPGYN